MPVEFALRPRIRLREAPAPARRARARLPKFALPALAYWLVIGGLVYQFVRHHDVSAPPPRAEAALAPITPASPSTVRNWWRPLPAPTPLPSLPIAEPPAAELEAVEPPRGELEAVEPPLAKIEAVEPPLAEIAPAEPALLSLDPVHVP